MYFWAKKKEGGFSNIVFSSESLHMTSNGLVEILELVRATCVRCTELSAYFTRRFFLFSLVLLFPVVTFLPEGMVLEIVLGLLGTKNIRIPTQPPTTQEQKRRVFSKVVLGFLNFGYDF
jgi:hypothetical protein